MSRQRYTPEFKDETGAPAYAPDMPTDEEAGETIGSSMIGILSKNRTGGPAEKFVAGRAARQCQSLFLQPLQAER